MFFPWLLDPSCAKIGFMQRETTDTQTTSRKRSFWCPMTQKHKTSTEFHYKTIQNNNAGRHHRFCFFRPPLKPPGLVTTRGAASRFASSLEPLGGFGVFWMSLDVFWLECFLCFCKHAVGLRIDQVCLMVLCFFKFTSRCSVFPATFPNGFTEI